MWPNQQFSADLVTFTGEIFNGKLHFFFSVLSNWAKIWEVLDLESRDGSRTAAISKMERAVIIVNDWKLHLECCSSPRSASEKGLERLIFNSVLAFYMENTLLSPNQSHFETVDSCINQLLSTHIIFLNHSEMALK